MSTIDSSQDMSRDVEEEEDDEEEDRRPNKYDILGIVASCTI